METGSDGGGKLAALADPSASGVAAKAGRKYLVRGKRGNLRLKTRSTGSCHLTIFPRTSPTGTRGKETRRNRGSALSMTERPWS